MVIDTIDNLSKYVGLNPLFADVVAFLKANDLSKMEEGKHPIQGTDLFVNVTTAKGRAKEAAVLETHIDMIDIQIPLDTEETFGYTPLCDLPDYEYNAEKDITKYGDTMAQTYFAVKTRQQELIEHYEELTEDQKRLAIRREMTEHNKSLAEAAKMAGIVEPLDYAIFQNRGYQGLYGGLGVKEIHERKGLKKNEHILDHMGSTELAANLFRATQTDEKLRRENIRGKKAACDTHYEVGAKVRKTIKELGGAMPEDLPTPEKSVKQLEAEQKKKKLRG